MAAANSPRRDIIHSKHKVLCKDIIRAAIVPFAFAGLYAPVALYGMILQSFQAVDECFTFLLIMWFFISFGVVAASGLILPVYVRDLR